MKMLSKIEPKNLVHGRTRTMYYPLGSATVKERAYEEARILRRLGYNAQVWMYPQAPHTNDDVRFIVMVANQWLYTSSGK